jgi:hypothetical protein
VATSWGSTTTAGNTLIAVLMIALPSGSGPAVTPPSGWTLTTINEINNGPAPEIKIYTIDNASARSGSESFSLSPGSQDASLTLIEVAGLQTTAKDLFVSNFNTTSVTTFDTTATGTTTVAAEYWLAVAANRNSGSVPGSPTGGFTNIFTATTGNATAGSAIGYAVADQVVSAAAAAQCTWTVGSARPYAAAVLTFKGSTPAAPVNTVAPAVTGTPTEGLVLTSDTGTWTG